ncbi:MAG: hypothetical protein ACE5FJ_02870 [Gemmatimonadales bacterium]
MLKKLLVGAAAAALYAVAAPATASAQMMGNAPEGEAATVHGTVVDLSCKFRHGLTGDDHRMCAQVCADRGIPLAILGDDGTLYMPVSGGMPGDDQNARLRDFAEQGVTVRGTVFDAGGAKAIEIENISRS